MSDFFDIKIDLSWAKDVADWARGLGENMAKAADRKKRLSPEENLSLAFRAARSVGEDPDKVVKVGPKENSIYFKVKKDGWFETDVQYRINTDSYSIQRFSPTAAAGCNPSDPDKAYKDIGQIDTSDASDSADQSLGPDISPDKEGEEVKDECLSSPQSYMGDGEYKVKTGDSIEASNGVVIKITGQGEASDLFSFASYYLHTDIYAGSEKLNMVPVVFTDSWCRNIYGIHLYMGKNAEVDECDRVSVKAASFYEGPIESRQDLYKGCLDMGITHDICTDYIPWEPAPTEEIYESGKFKVFTPPDKDPIIGEYMLAQLEYCYGGLTDKFGIEEVLPAIALRLCEHEGGYNWPVPHADLHINWPLEADKGKWEELKERAEENIDSIECVEPILAHEQMHLLEKGINYHKYLKEGMARIAEYYIGAKKLTDQPYYSGAVATGKEFELPVSEGKVIKVTVGDIDTENQKVVFNFDGIERLVDVHSYTIFATQVLAVVESIQDSKADIGLYIEPEIPYTNIPVRGETGYTTPLGFLIGDVFYHKEDGKLDETPYQSLSNVTDNTEAYDTAFCSLMEYSDTYGDDVLSQFLDKGEEVRENTLAGISTEFCWVKGLSDVAGADLSDLFEKYDMIYDGENCYYPWKDSGPFVDKQHPCSP